MLSPPQSHQVLVKSSLQYAIKDYQNGKSPTSEYFIYPMSDDEVLSFREKNTDAEDKPTAEGDDFIPIGTTAYHVIDYKRVIPVRIDDRKAFLYDCTSLTDGHHHYIPYHQIFRTEKEANDRFTERNTRRDAAIEQYHLLEVSDNEEINRDRETALSWLHFNLDPPAGLTEKLLEYLI